MWTARKYDGTKAELPDSQGEGVSSLQNNDIFVFIRSDDLMLQLKGDEGGGGTTLPHPDQAFVRAHLLPLQFAVTFFPTSLSMVVEGNDRSTLVIRTEPPYCFPISFLFVADGNICMF